MLRYTGRPFDAVSRAPVTHVTSEARSGWPNSHAMTTSPYNRAAVAATAARASAKERSAFRVMMAFAATGIFFMLFPGTLLGVWNLVSISARHSAEAVSTAWIQAHGHAQLFGWIGTFVIGIGYRSLPASCKKTLLGVDEGWWSLGLWASGVLLRWTVGMEPAAWRVLLPLAAVLELAGLALFVRASLGHRPEGGGQPGAWALVVMGGTAGFLLALAAHAWIAFDVALAGESPAFPPEANARFLTLATWGFVVPFVWGFTAKWVSTLLGLAAPSGRGLVAAYLVSVAGVAFAVAGWHLTAAWLLLAASVGAVAALRLFERATGRPRLQGVHRSFPVFVRLAYGWLLVAAALFVWAASSGSNAAGILGGSRHALTVGFFSTMVFSVGPRILPTFAGRTKLFSKRLMALALVTVTIGCTTRVLAEILAYQGYAAGAWGWLPVSAVIELGAFVLFAANMAATFVWSPEIVRKRYPSRSGYYAVD
jgi:uncharacterized protein involved in response to NO